LRLAARAQDGIGLGMLEDDQELFFGDSFSSLTYTPHAQQHGKGTGSMSSAVTSDTCTAADQGCDGARATSAEDHCANCPICALVAAEQIAAALQAQLEDEREIAETLKSEAEVLRERQVNQKVEQAVLEEQKNFLEKLEKEEFTQKASKLPQSWWEQKEGFRTVRAYRFTLKGELHQVAVAHAKCIWTVAVDDVIVLRESHDKYNYCYSESSDMVFRVAKLDGRLVEARVRAKRPLFPHRWKYELWVNGYQVPECWTPKKDKRKTQVDMEVMARPCPKKGWNKFAHQK